jgi:hypothetical protein
MQLLVILTDEVHTAALRHARTLGRGSPLPPHLMNAMLDDEIATWVGKVWNEVESAIRRACSDGYESARSVIEKVSERLSEVTARFAERAEEVRGIITARLNDYLQQAIDGALRSVRSTIAIGGRDLKITNVTIEQGIKLSGSLKASLDSICEFIAEGEISLTAEYGAKE